MTTVAVPRRDFSQIVFPHRQDLCRNRLIGTCAAQQQPFPFPQAAWKWNASPPKTTCCDSVSIQRSPHLMLILSPPHPIPARRVELPTEA
ncbi:hypothetical protein BHE90_002020 [Fusarium euwallaceae]|uniref:Uncharacterized protein n=1 Tax=Fusarium euwallaceae TaxID=1147111 RepID=A0A430M5V7_9HYPO|nr:hypothetical protein BHE90_002020 [Fusarium euwallaceae]